MGCAYLKECTGFLGMRHGGMENGSDIQRWLILEPSKVSIGIPNTHVYVNMNIMSNGLEELSYSSMNEL